MKFCVFLKELPLRSEDFEELDWLTEPQEVLLHSADIVLVDSYLVSGEWLATARKHVQKLVQIDDFNRIVYPVDLIINPNIFAGDIDYSSQKATCVGGPDFVILRKSFRTGVEKPTEKEQTTVLITVGGSDYRGLLPKLTDWALAAGNFEVRVVIPHEAYAVAEEAHVLPLLNEAEMLREMNYADIVISACGQTLHELAALRKVVIGICLDVDQEPNHAFYNKAGFISGMLWWDQPNLEECVKNQLVNLGSPSTRLERARQSPPINVQGVAKVAEAILK